MTPGYPTVDYGQEAGKAWNPATREELYRMVQRARSDAALANLFAADIMTAKGEFKVMRSFPGMAGKETTPQERKRQYRLDDRDPLYIEHSLNAAESWASQAFDTPVVKGEDGNYYYARNQASKPGGHFSKPQIRNTNQSQSQLYNFHAGDKVTDNTLIQRLNNGAYAFSAKGDNGLTVYVPYADGYTPYKNDASAGARNLKDTVQSATARNVRTAHTVEPQVVSNPLGQQTTLLSGASSYVPPKLKTLLG